MSWVALSIFPSGQAESNPQAKRGYSRDKRPDCKQVLVGLVIGDRGCASSADSRGTRFTFSA